jgi:hypothetical protein
MPVLTISIDALFAETVFDWIVFFREATFAQKSHEIHDFFKLISSSQATKALKSGVIIYIMDDLCNFYGCGRLG